MTSLSQKIEKLFSDQLIDWELARTNYRLLDRVLTREIDYGDFRINVQFNPERIRSSSAKVDSKTINERPCFLCTNNRPSEQQGITFSNSLLILVNPFPIFRRHLTIPSEKHSDQRISGNFELMLQLSRELEDYTVFYNGPQCGASAPDHFHFQAGNRGFMPLENDFEKGTSVKLLTEKGPLQIWQWEDYMRGIITLKGPDIKSLTNIFNLFYSEMEMLQPGKPEPMMNILSCFEGGEWIIHMIPRKLHRPARFFAQGEEQILLSPASVDIGGVLITPRESDYLRLTESDVRDMFSQVCFSDEEILQIVNKMI